MKGKCLCGSIEVDTSDQNEVVLCHCGMCRRWASGPMLTVHCGKEVKFTGESLSSYKSSDWAERGFCQKCGTHLYYFLPQSSEYMLSAGLFPGKEFSLTSQIFIDEKPAYYEFSNQTKNLTGRQVFELYAPKS